LKAAKSLLQSRSNTNFCKKIKSFCANSCSYSINEGESMVMIMKMSTIEYKVFRKNVKAINNSVYSEFAHQFIQLANENIILFVSLPDMKAYSFNRNYFKKFKDYMNVYLNEPCISFIGIYVMKGRFFI